MSQIRLSQMAPLPEIRGVTLGKTIGQGGFGVVKAAQYVKKGVTIAVKFVYLSRPDSQHDPSKSLLTEARIQKACKHKNIIALFDFKQCDPWFWMAMELGANGELFDKIEPDVGVDEHVAQFYFKQLINAVDYIHTIGVAHRDIKPENLVLDIHGNLKLTDFGLAIVYKRKRGPRRKTATKCGSPPYLAPEIAMGSYDPEMSDMWSCGIVLFVLLTGRIPWEFAHEENLDYKHYLKNKGDILVSPWNKLPISALSLLRKVLHPNPDKRVNVSEIRKQPWFAKKNSFMDENDMCKDTLKLTTRLLIGLYIGLTDDEYNKVEMTATQLPVRNVAETQPMIMDDLSQEDRLFKDNYVSGMASSQIEYTARTKRRKLKGTSAEDERIFSAISRDPASLQFLKKGREEAINAKILSLQHQGSTANLFAMSLTRFFSRSPMVHVVLTLMEALTKVGILYSVDFEATEDSVNSFCQDQTSKELVTIPVHGIDTGEMAVIGLIKVMKLEDNIDVRQVDFIRQRGDPLEWRRMFRKVTILCRDIVYVER